MKIICVIMTKAENFQQVLNEASPELQQQIESCLHPLAHDGQILYVHWL